MPTDWEDARDDDARCGHKGRLWESVLELTAEDGGPECP
jgi:hypothetical protein